MNLPKSQLFEDAVRMGMGRFSADGALVVNTGKHTGRAADSRYIVKHAETAGNIAWGPVNKPIDPDVAMRFTEALERKVRDHSPAYTYRGYVGGFPIEVHTVSPWHAAFAANMFRDTPVASIAKAAGDQVKVVIYHHPFISAKDLVADMPSDTAIVVDPLHMRVSITGTAYAGEIKKSAFTLCNYKLPEYGFLPMHASANTLEGGRGSSVLFGLSGTGKTTLSADPARYLIGDDEIVWTPGGLSNLEGGCYAKLIDLTVEREPEIFRAVNRFGAIMENIVLDGNTRRPLFDNQSITENTRGSYSLEVLQKIHDQAVEADAPNSIIFLTADAFGAMPPVAKLDPWQTQFHFVSGYTAKVAGTEIGVKEPTAAFSACFGAPFMPRHVTEYAALLARYAATTGASVWLLNTGWMKGGYGKSQRFPLPVTRALLHSIQSGELDSVPSEAHPIFGFQVPKEIPGLSRDQLPDPTSDTVRVLAKRFVDNIDKLSVAGTRFEDRMIEAGAPRV